jgi:hypothetical protein
VRPGAFAAVRGSHAGRRPGVGPALLFERADGGRLRAVADGHDPLDHVKDRLLPSNRRPATSRSARGAPRA